MFIGKIISSDTWQFKGLTIGVSFKIISKSRQKFEKMAQLDTFYKESPGN